MSPDINCPLLMMTFPGEEMPPILQGVKKILIRITVTGYISVMVMSII